MFGKALAIAPLFVLLFSGSAMAVDEQTAAWLHQRTETYQTAARGAARTDPEAYRGALEKYTKYRERRAEAWTELRRERAIQWQQQADAERLNPNLAVVRYARTLIGVPYRWGGASPSGVDCSGLVLLAFRRGRGISLPHYSGAQGRAGRGVSLSEARPGDILVYSGHVALVSGPGRMIDAPNSGRAVTERALRTSGLRGVRRIG